MLSIPSTKKQTNKKQMNTDVDEGCKHYDKKLVTKDHTLLHLRERSSIGKYVGTERRLILAWRERGIRCTVLCCD